MRSISSISKKLLYFSHFYSFKDIWEPKKNTFTNQQRVMIRTDWCLYLFSEGGHRLQQICWFSFLNNYLVNFFLGRGNFWASLLHLQLNCCNYLLSLFRRVGMINIIINMLSVGLVKGILYIAYLMFNTF